MSKTDSLKGTFSQLPGSLGPDYNYLHAKQISYQLKLALTKYLTMQDNCWCLVYRSNWYHCLQ